MKKFKQSVLGFLVCLLMVNGLGICASAKEIQCDEINHDDEDGIALVYYYESEEEKNPNEEIINSLEEKIEIEGKKYELSDYFDEVIQKKENRQQVVKKIKKENLTKKEYEAKDTHEFVIDGRSYSFKLSDIEYTKQPIETQELSVSSQYINETIPSEMEAEFIDKRTGKKLKTVLPYASKEVTGTTWLDIQIPMTVFVYDAVYYDINGTKIYKDSLGNLDIKGKESAILNYLGLNSSQYQLNSVAWNGEAYTVDGEMRRNAVAYGKCKANIEKVTFADEVELPQLYTATMTYKAEIPDGTFLYQHQFTANYKLVDHTKLYIVISVAVIFLLILLVLILWILAKRKREEKRDVEKQ